MARKKPQLTEGQMSMLDANNTPFNQADTEGAYAVTYGPEGSYVDVAKRAELLGSSLLALGKRNQRLGFDVASHQRPYSEPIWGRYQDLTPIVIEGAQRNVYNFLDVAKRDFWAATGFAALRAARNRGENVVGVSDGQIDSRGRKMWRDFTEAYGDPQKRVKRDRFKRVLKKATKQAGKGSKELAA